MRRLQRDNPELVEQVKTGEIRSVRAAAIKAGIIKDVPTVRMNDPTKAAQSIVSRMGEDWATHRAAAITELVAGA